MKLKHKILSCAVLSVLSVLCAVFSFAFVKEPAKADGTGTASEVLQYPLNGLNLVTVQLPEYSVRLQGSNNDVYGLDITNGDAVITDYQDDRLLSKVTLTRGEDTYSCYKVIHNGAGVIYRFPIAIPWESQTGDKFTIEEDFRIVLPENAKYSAGKGTRTFSYGERISYIYDGANWVDASKTDEEYDDTVFTYIAAPVIRDSMMTISLKSAVPLNVNKADSELLDGISLNGKTLTALIAEGNTSVTTEISALRVTTPKSVFKFDGTDSIGIEKGKTCFTYLSGKKLKTRDAETFTYSAKLKRFELVPDMEAVKANSRYVTIEHIEYAGKLLDGYQTGDYRGESLWITFMAKTGHYAIGQMQSSLETLMTGRKKSETSDMINYEFARNGAFKAIMDCLCINGKTIREWMELDAEAGNGELIKINYLGVNINGGKVLRIQAATAPADSTQKQVHSLLGETMGCEKDMSVEIKEGFVTPNSFYVGKNLYYEVKADEFINLTTDDETRRGVQTRFRNVKKDKPYVENEVSTDDSGNSGNDNRESSCAGAVSASQGVLALCLIFVSVLLMIRSKKREGKENE